MSDKLRHIRMYDKYLRLARDDIRKLYDVAVVWDQIPSYIRFAVLQSCGQIRTWIGNLRSAKALGRLTKRQLKELAVLERQFDDVLGTLEILKKRDQELYERERTSEQLECDDGTV